MKLNEKLHENLNKFIISFDKTESPFSGVVLVTQNNNIMFFENYGMANYELNVANSAETKFRVCSISKQFTAMAIMQLHSKGLLSVNDPIIKFIPDFEGGENITIHHLLTHSSGLLNYTKLPEFKKIKSLKATPLEIISLFKNRPLEFAPGAQFKYGNSSYVLLAYIIEKISRQSYEEFMNQNIFIPLKMNQSGCENQKGLIQNRASGYQLIGKDLVNTDLVDMSVIIGAANVYSTAEDLLKWNKALFSNKLLPQEKQEAMFTPHIVSTNFFQESFHGYGLHRAKILGHECIGHFGRFSGFHTCLLNCIKENLSIIILSNIEESPIEPIAEKIVALCTKNEMEN